MDHSMPGLPVHHQLLEFTQTHVHQVGDAIHPSHPLHPLLLLPPIPPSIRVFSNESTLRMRWPKYWNFSFSISPSNEHPGLISFRMDWLAAEMSYCTPEVRAAAERSYRTPEVRGGSWKEQPRVQGAAAAPGQPRGATLHPKSGEAAVRRYPLSKVRSSGCALLEQPWRDTPHPR